MAETMMLGLRLTQEGVDCRRFPAASAWTRARSSPPRSRSSPGAACWKLPGTTCA